MRVTKFLDESAVPYDVTDHIPTFTAQQMAAAEHEPGRYVAKPVIVRVDGKYTMCVLAACYKIDLGELKSRLGARSVDLALEKEIGETFDDCELGAEPPLIMDKALEKDDHIIFQAGAHDKAIRMRMDDYRRLVKPKVLEFSYHMTS